MDESLAQRITERRNQLGLTVEELARRAGMAPGYLVDLINAGPAFDPGGYLRLATALGLSDHDLLEGRADAAPGQALAAPRPVLVRLTEEECWEKLGTYGVGRIVLPAEPSPGVFPVNYLVDAATVVYRTAPRSAVAAEAGTHLSFQADRIDDHLSTGWSVLVLGTAEHVHDPDDLERLARRRGAEPWAGGDRPLWVRVRPEQVSGRRIGTL